MLLWFVHLVGDLHVFWQLGFQMGASANSGRGAQVFRGHDLLHGTPGNLGTGCLTPFSS